MKKLMSVALLAAMATTGACAYGGIAATGDGKAVVARNDGFLFGLLRKVYVCNVTPGGLTGCVAGENP